MKHRLLLVGVFLAGLVVGALVSPVRFAIVSGGEVTAFRLDRLTGAVEFISGDTRHPVKPTFDPSTAKPDGR